MHREAARQARGARLELAGKVHTHWKRKTPWMKRHIPGMHDREPADVGEVQRVSVKTTTLPSRHAQQGGQDQSPASKIQAGIRGLTFPFAWAPPRLVATHESVIDCHHRFKQAMWPFLEAGHILPNLIGRLATICLLCHSRHSEVLHLGVSAASARVSQPQPATSMQLAHYLPSQHNGHEGLPP